MKLFDVNEEYADELVKSWREDEEISEEEAATIKSELMNYPIEETTEKILIHWGSDVMGREAMHITAYPHDNVIRMTEETAKFVKEKIERFLYTCEARRRNRDKKPWEWIAENCD